MYPEVLKLIESKTNLINMITKLIDESRYHTFLENYEQADSLNKTLEIICKDLPELLKTNQ